MRKTGLYCLIQGGQITDGPRLLPTSWQTADRSIGGFNVMLDESLAAHGWLPEWDNRDQPFDSTTQTRTGPARTVLADRVESIYTVSAKTAQEIADAKGALANIILNEPGLRAYAKCINDGSIVPGSNMTNAQLKAAIVAKL